MSKVTEAHLRARRQEIIDACARVFAAKGLAGATVADIAAEAGISPGAVYRYFRSKDELAAACLTEGAQRVAAEWELKFSGAPDARATFLDISANTFDELKQKEANDRTRLMLQHYLEATRAGSATLAACRRERETLIDGLTRGLQLMKDSNQLPADTDVRGLAAALWSFWLGARISRLLDPATDTDSQLAALAAILTAAGQASGAAASAAGRPPALPSR